MGATTLFKLCRGRLRYSDYTVGALRYSDCTVGTPTLFRLYRGCANAIQIVPFGMLFGVLYRGYSAYAT